MRFPKILRLALVASLAVGAYLVGRWERGHPGSRGAPAGPEPVADGSGTPAQSNPFVAEVESIANAARFMAEPDARTYQFFETLPAAELPAVVAFIERLPAGNEQDLLFQLAIRRWAQIDGPAALARTTAFPALSTRANSRLAAFETWATRDGAAAMERALEQPEGTARNRALTAVFAGAATSDPRNSLMLLQLAPPSFRDSPNGLAAAQRIASAACGTGKREAVQALVGGMPVGPVRFALIEAVAREWGGHYPDEALAWVESVIPPGDARDEATGRMFTALTQRDPSRAANWAVQHSEQKRQPSLIAAAVAEWTELDTVAAEIWVNEQPAGRYLDGASYAMATHFIGLGELQRAFAWIRRIDQGEIRGEMLANLGRLWARERPDEFRKFVDQTSLNRTEVEMLFSKITEPRS